ncbi:3-hydroxyacyl-ACP dehydratase FabZ [Buchnera aphidicola]|uniref:3-hydroxyacyl-ACP dehydratase FabZ n=1 Tax=Buchnera aphidicola TaxID=9 RepID=UPI0031B89CDF
MKNKIRMNNSISETIFNVLPHRFPFLFIDRIIEMRNNEYIRAIKNVSINESIFQGHFPTDPVFPGVLILESIAQASGVLIINSNNEINHNYKYFLINISKACFRKLVVPGDQMFIEVFIKKRKLNLINFFGVVTVDRYVVCQTMMTCYLKK